MITSAQQRIARQRDALAIFLEHGIFHCEIHFSGNRATIWS
jgi:hypothetical protein